MKSKKLLLFILAPYLFFAQTNIKADYVMINTFTKKLDKKEMMKEHPKMAEKYFDNAIELLMNNNDKKAVFQLKIRDSISSFLLQPKNENESGINIAYIISKVAGNYFTNLNTGEIINDKEFKGSAFLVTYTKQDVIWNITNEQKKIGNYECYKANTTYNDVFKDAKIESRPIEAWFCPSIPIKAGPYQFSGLPGLVIIVTDNKTFTTYLQNLELNPKDTEVEKVSEKGKKVTISEYLKYESKNL
ncbi:GLPGLI family protein [Halpernia frigidisoli]|uniref:GLPGLI family protein n=1 Tax=Halpernia frigidisoli TaxID=1125876 RepID=A0A1I3I3U1_9FLAO|nr:GLPGLI family protein [Halpernia frigidisoli]SFI42582.1 GLPGLI family protein [Halpernia frigidisoli]